MTKIHGYMRSRKSMSKCFKVSLAIFIVFSPFTIEICKADSPKRIASLYQDLSRPQKIYLYAGLISVIEFPKEITEVRVGDPASLKVQLSQVSPKELTIQIKDREAGATNLVVRAERRVYVFDIIPSKKSHQDYIRIIGAYGAPAPPNLNSLSSVQLAPKQNKVSNGRVLELYKLGGE